MKIVPLNFTAKEFCQYIGISYHGEILRQLRRLELVSYFKVGRKYLYPRKDAEKINNLLLNKKIEIRTSEGYWIALLDDDLIKTEEFINQK